MEVRLRGLSQPLRLLGGAAIAAALVGVSGVTGTTASQAASAPNIVGTYTGTFTST